MKERDLCEFDDLEELEGKAMDAAVKVAKDVLSLKVLEENLANHYSRGVALKEQGKLREAMGEFFVILSIMKVSHIKLSIGFLIGEKANILKVPGSRCMGMIKT